MVPLTELWLPILLAAVLVFIASSIIHMLLTYHRSSYRKLPDEEALMAAMRKVEPGVYTFPHSKSPKEMGSPEMIEKYRKGPVGLITMMRNGPPPMGKLLTLWFLYSILIGIFAAYVAGRCLGPGAEYLAVFRLTGTVAFVAYSVSYLVNSIWWGQPWSGTFKQMFDGLVYALLTAGAFGWLWP